MRGLRFQNRDEMKCCFKVSGAFCIGHVNIFNCLWSLLLSVAIYLPTSTAGREQCGHTEHTSKFLLALALKSTSAAFNNSWFSEHLKTSASQSLAVENCRKANTWGWKFCFIFWCWYASFVFPNIDVIFFLSLMFFLLYTYCDAYRDNH